MSRTYLTIPFRYELTEGTNFEGYKHVIQDFWGHNRWDITYANVFKADDGTHWAYVYQVGATEYQDGGYENPDEGDPVELVKVKASTPTFRPDEGS